MDEHTQKAKAGAFSGTNRPRMRLTHIQIKRNLQSAVGIAVTRAITANQWGLWRRQVACTATTTNIRNRRRRTQAVGSSRSIVYFVRPSHVKLVAPQIGRGQGHRLCILGSRRTLLHRC